ncbi:MAG: response regulator transcription factor [Bacteroidetes bacterium]|nr:response regulator transcription factor [Bacteroidota bacterium]
MASPHIITTLIADDHTLVRRGFVQILSLYPEFSVAAEVGNGRDAVEQAKALRPRLVMMDLNMPELNGIEATRLIKKFDPSITVVVVSAYQDDGFVQQVYYCGANGYLLKTADPDLLRSSLMKAVDSDSFVCPHLAPEHLRVLIHPAQSEERTPQQLINQLTTREREIIQLIAEAKSHQQIADQLNISVRTVDTHHNNILHKLDVHDSVALVTFAIKHRLVVL